MLLIFGRSFVLRNEHEGAGSGAPGAEGGAQGGGNEGKDTGQGEESRRRQVAWEDHKRALDDLAKEKKRRKELEDAENKREEERLKAEGRFKEAAEKAEREREEARQQAETVTSTFKNTLRSAKVAELAAKAGLRDEARDDLDLLDLGEEVEVEETSSGRFLVRGADKFVERLKKAKPHWFKDGKPPTFNAGGGKGKIDAEGGDGAVTLDTVWELEKKYGRKDPRFVKAWNTYLEQRSKNK